MSYVLKIKYGDTLRRITVPKRTFSDGPDLTFAGLENIINDLFKIPPTARKIITYIDKEHDVVTMADNHDLDDACIEQLLNPLRLTVTLANCNGEKSSGDPSQVEITGTAGQGLESPESKPNTLDQLRASWHSRACSSSPVITGIVNGVKIPVEGLLGSNVANNSSAKELSASYSQPEKKVVDAWLTSGGLHADSEKPTAKRTVGDSAGHIPPVVQPDLFNTLLGIGRAAVCPAAFASTEKLSIESIADGNRSIHNGVQCDGCGMSPIVGPRFKSAKKHDYDLCSICFEKVKYKADYARIDRPLFRPRHHHPPIHGGRMRCTMNTPFHGGKTSSLRSAVYCGKPVWGGIASQMASAFGKLDARFVQDVTILDGTELAPGSHFTKIWRLRNSGTLAWPARTQLVHVGGDELGSVYSVPLEIPQLGLPPEAEIEAAVELIAPEKAGRYVSHWRLASPAGPKFGHRVWVLIQVVRKDERSVTNDTPHAFESNKAFDAAQVVPGLNSDAGTNIVEVEKSNGIGGDSAGVSNEVGGGLASVSELGERIDPAVISEVDERLDLEDKATGVEEDFLIAGKTPELNELVPNLTEEVYVPELITEAGSDCNSGLKLLVETVDLDQGSRDDGTLMENSELGGFSMVEHPSESSGLGQTSPVKTHVMDANKEEVAVDETARLLSKLEAMGFKETLLNLDLLEKNKYDLRNTLDDLVAAAEWDPIVEELEEMGFYDTEMIRRLMFKNKGSVKRVVKYLVHMHKDVGTGKEYSEIW